MQVNFVEYPAFSIKGVFFVVVWTVAGFVFLSYHIVEK